MVLVHVPVVVILTEQLNVQHTSRLVCVAAGAKSPEKII